VAEIGTPDEFESLSPEERRQRRLTVLESTRELHRQILAERGGESIPVELIDGILDEIRGRTGPFVCACGRAH
jgi:hypothetical protein